MAERKRNLSCGHIVVMISAAMDSCSSGSGLLVARRRVSILPAILLLLASCASSSNRPADVLKPDQASSIASAYAVQREKSIQADDMSALKQNEADPMLGIDLEFAKDTARFNLTNKIPTVTSADSYVAHQSSFPSWFLSIVHFQDGSAALMGFAQNADRRWVLMLYADVPKNSDVALAKMKDGFAPTPTDPSPKSGYRFDPADLLAWYLNHKCATTPGCQINEDMKQYNISGITRDPPGYTPDLVSADALDSDIAEVTAAAQSYRSDGYQIRYDATPGGLLDFPWYRMADGGSLHFVDLGEGFDVRPIRGCFTTTATGQLVDAILEPGTYKEVTERRSLMLAVEVPATASSGQLRVVADSPWLLGNNLDTC